MEWRIIVPVLCLIGIIHVPGNAAQANNTNSTSTNSTIVYRFSLSFSINDTFHSNYSNMASNAASDLKNNIISQVEPLYRANYTNYIGLNISQFREGSIVTDGELQFRYGSKPNATDLVQILNKGNVSIRIINASINITDITPPPAPATTPAAPAVTNTTVAPTTAAPENVAKINLVLKFFQDFKSIYANLSDPETNELSNNITSECSKVFKKHFPKFKKMYIKRFSQGSIVADSVLEFVSTNGSRAPNASEVKDTFTAAIANGEFSFKVDNTSINATDITDTNVTTAATTSITTQVPTASNLAEYNITFKMNEDFSDDLSNMASAAAIKLATNITTELNNFFKDFKNFSRLLVWKFRKGSIEVDARSLFFKDKSNPEVGVLATGFAEAVRNGKIKLSVDPKSIKVTDSNGQTANRSPVLASMLTASWMTLTSLLLSAVMH